MQWKNNREVVQFYARTWDLLAIDIYGYMLWCEAPQYPWRNGDFI